MKIVTPESGERIALRRDITESEKALAVTAKRAGLQFYDRFHNAGYVGMYNMELRKLKQIRGVPDPSRPLLDFMGREELSANLFRLTLTDGRIKKDNVRGQANLEETARRAGRIVREMLIEETGTAPENYPLVSDLKRVVKGLKTVGDVFEQIDDLDAQRQLQLESFTVDLSDCPECIARGNTASHYGSPQCNSGSLAAGGTVAHCGCEYCSPFTPLDE
jgi:hypothetical protein